MLDAMVDTSLVEGLRPISRREYEQMGQLGMFRDERVELLRGMLVKKMTIGWLHAEVVSWLTRELVLQLGRAYQVRTQSPFAASEWSEPEPDVAIARIDKTRRDHPSELQLVIEVAESSLRRDRGVKLGIYAETGVPEYWVIDLTTMTVEVYTQPSGDGYAHVETLTDGVLRPTQLPGVALAIAEMPR